MRERHVYTPDFDGEEFVEFHDGGRRRLMLGAVMAIVVGALAVVAWNTYGRSGEPPLLSAESAAYKTAAPRVEQAAAPSPELYDAIDGAPRALTTHAADAQRALPAAPAAVAEPGAPGASGAFLVQLAALRGRDQAEEAWKLFATRAPSLARSARMDVQRADLGAQGVFYRLRAGYFESRDKASAYCERAKEQGQECMVVVR